MRRPRRFHVESLEDRVVLSQVLPSSAPAHGAALLATQDPTQSSTGLNPKTLKNLQSAMEGESLAYATYRAYAAVTQQSGLASAWNNIAEVEFADHFTQEAQFSGLVGDNASNLRTVIAAEADAIKTYTKDAQQAFKAGYQEIGKTFQEIAADESTHLDLFTKALNALETTGTVPSTLAPPPVVPTTIVRSEPAARGRTLINIIDASHSEAFAWAQYTLYAQEANNTKQPGLATLFTNIAQMELEDHFAKEANLSGLVGSDVDNLRASIAAETEAVKTYQHYAKQANHAGDQAVAALFGEIAIDEQGHAKTFQELLNSQTGQTH